jgi:hypothetical protein
MAYDIIGDIHGHHDRLLGLLRKLGYRDSAGAWRHPSRQAIFVGDFIDRGPRQLETLGTVRRMVDAGSALALMGNHEFNALAWYTEDPDHPGHHLRPRHGELGAKNRHQHQAFLSEIEHQPARYRDVVDWFYTLPLWLELPGLRVVHACWHEGHMRALSPKLRDGARLTPGLLVSASRRHSADFRAVETVLKGVEVPLPGGRSFQDKDGITRREVRVRWWDPDATTFRKAAIAPGQDSELLPDDPLPESARPGYAGDKPVFFGHYWMRGRPAVQTPMAACVDYSAGKGGALVAYRWDGEARLDSARFEDF